MRIGCGIGIGAGGASTPDWLAAWYAAGIDVDLDPANGVTFDGSNRVSAWMPRRGTSTALAQANGAKQPLYSATGNAVGGPIVEIDSAARCLISDTAPQAAAASMTIWAVIYRTATANGYWWGHEDTASANGHRLRANGTNQLIWNIGAGATSHTLYAHTGGWEVECVRLSASGGFGTTIDTRRYSVNGGAFATPSGTGNEKRGGANTTRLVVGQDGTAGTVKIARLLYASGTLFSEADCTTIANELRTRYGTP